jgi:hypothetical protein
VHAIHEAWSLYGCFCSQSFFGLYLSSDADCHGRGEVQRFEYQHTPAGVVLA